MTAGIGASGIFSISSTFVKTGCKAVTTAIPTVGKNCCVNSTLTRHQRITWESAAEDSPEHSYSSSTHVFSSF